MMPHSTFENYGLPSKLLQALVRNKFTTPTPVQAQTIPLALEGKDILGSAQTGTGKTGAFGIPVIAGLMKNPEAFALIMTPTRELASQVLAALEPMIPTVDIRTALLIGGEPMPKQMHQLRHNPRLIVGTPGRINDHLERGSLKLDNVRFLVLDETDRMLDMGFGIQIERILKHVPDERQTLLFSATLPSNITKLSSKYMREPVRVAVGATHDTAANIKQEVIPVTDSEKYGKLLEQIDARKGSIIIFVKTKFGTEKLADKLTKDNHRADAIHGDLQQRRRERVIQNFRDKKYRVLVATDVAARGLDIPHIAHVINYDMPQAPEDYIHRIGRTARAGAQGEAVSFLTGADNVKWRAIQRLLNGEDPNAPAPRSGGGGGGARRGFGGGGGRKPAWKTDGARSPRGDRPYGDKPRGERTFSDKPRAERAHADKPASDRPHSDRPRSERPHSDKPHSEKPRSEKPASDWTPSDRVRADRPFADRPGRSDKPRGERTFSDKPRGDRPFGDKPRGERTFGDKPRGERAFGDKARGERTFSDKPRGEKPRGDKPASDRPYSDKPRGERAAAGDKPFAGKPRSGKPFGGKPGGGKPFRAKAAAPRARS